MGRIATYIEFLKKIKVVDFIYLNYICKSVIRTDNSKLIPYKNTVIELAPDAKIFLKGGDIEIGCNLLKRSKAETRLRIGEGAIWCSAGGCKVSYGSTIELLDGAVFDTGYFTMNCNSALVSAKRIVLGNDVMISRNVVIYDSDFHSIVDEQGKTKNQPKAVCVRDHVWIGANVIILKGSTIGDDCIIGAGAIVNQPVPENSIYHSYGEKRINILKGSWIRKAP